MSQDTDNKTTDNNAFAGGEGAEIVRNTLQESEQDIRDLNDCGCCETIDLRYAKHHNPPGQPALDYRLGKHSRFFEHMLAGLSRDQLPGTGVSDERPLRPLGTRELDDPSIALLDAWAMVADVVSFYQERIANEGYIRTAVERQSVLELARSIGYELNSGVAADTYLAFVAEDAAGAPEAARVDMGTRVLSIPDEESLPQTFETLETIIARAAWNALQAYTPLIRQTESLANGQTSLRFAGLSSGLQVGDVIQIMDKHDRNHWHLRTLNQLETDPEQNFTRVYWHQPFDNIQTEIEFNVYALRLRAALFGHNAAELNSLSIASRATFIGGALDSNQPLAVSPDGQSIVAIDSQPRVQLWTPNHLGEWTAKAVLTSANVDLTSLSAIALSTDSNNSVDRIFLAYANGKLLQLSKNLSGWVETLFGKATDTAVHHSPILTLGVSNQGPYLLSSSRENNIDDNQLWQLDNLQSLESQFTGQLEVKDGSDRFRVSSDAAKLIYWEQKGANKWTSVSVADTAHEGGVTAQSIHLNDSFTILLSGGNDGSIKVWKKEKGELVWQLDLLISGASSRKSAVVSLALSTDTSLLLARYADGWSRVWQLDNEVLQHEFTEQSLVYLSQWPNIMLSSASAQIELDNPYQTITPDSWIALMGPENEAIYQVQKNTPIWHSEFNLSARVSQLTLDTANDLNLFSRRDTTVFAQSESLELYESHLALTLPIESDIIELDSFQPQLEAGRTIIISGRPMRAKVLEDNLELRSLDGFTSVKLNKYDVLETLARPVSSLDLEQLEGWLWDPERQGFIADVCRFLTPNSEECEKPASDKPVTLNWQLRDRNGFIGIAGICDDNDICQKGVPHNALLLIEPLQPDTRTLQKNPRAGLISEVLVIERLDEVRHDDEGFINSRLTLQTGLSNIFDHNSVEINANTARASHGESIINEVLGSGNGAFANQRFQLNNIPLTYVSAATPSGGKSTLQVRVNGILWQEVESLFGTGARDQVYMVRHDNEGNSFLIFGDGINGARLPSGDENVHATYRKGIGLQGEVPIDRLKLMQSKPLGIREVNNYLPATGAAAPETFDQARMNAPLKVLTLDRIVSIQDYQDFTSAFSGVGKARAAQIWNGQRLFVHMTIASASGNTVQKNAALYRNLVQAIDQARDTTVPVSVDTFKPLNFELCANLKTDPRHRREEVEAAVRIALQTNFDFEHRNFGQSVTSAEVVAVIQRVPGVIAVNLSDLKISLPGTETCDSSPDNTDDEQALVLTKRLKAEPARWNGTEVALAQLLLINPSAEGIEIKEMPS